LVSATYLLAFKALCNSNLKQFRTQEKHNRLVQFFLPLVLSALLQVLASEVAFKIVKITNNHTKGYSLFREKPPAKIIINKRPNER